MNNRIPEEWCDILRAVRYMTGAPAIVAGGAVRDHFHGRPVRDLDIWVEGPHGIPNLGYKPNTKYDVFTRGITNIHSFYWHRTLVDLITVNRPLVEVVESFSIGLCQFYAREDGLIHGTDLAWADAADRTLSVKDGAYPPYVRKVMEKYPDFNLRS